jgi:hypothetical protein
VKLNVKAFALACGLFWGLGLFLLTWWIILWDGVGGGSALARLYRGYNVSPLGSLIGLGWAFGDGLVGGAVLAWLYNLLVDLGWGGKDS